MIKIELHPNVGFKSVDWGKVKHPVLVRSLFGSIYLTVPTHSNNSGDYYDYERDAICLRHIRTDKVGETVYKLNLENFELCEDQILIKNE